MENPGMVWRDVREKGSAWGMLFTLLVYRLLGRLVVEPVLWVVVAYFVATDRKMRQCSLQYLERVHDQLPGAPKPGVGRVYQHYLAFARTSLDRFDMWSDRINTFTYHRFGEDHLARLVQQKRGAVLLSAHIGNFDAMRALAEPRGGKVHILTDRQTSQNYSALLSRFAPRTEKGVIVRDSNSSDNVWELKRAVEEGEFVGLLGDRLAADSKRGAKRVSQVPFLGKPALFPHTPFIFASHMECPVLLLFSLRRSHRVYELYVEPFSDRIQFPEESRQEALDRYVTAYAARLEHYCRKMPLQWFNFYDFWATT